MGFRDGDAMRNLRVGLCAILFGTILVAGRAIADENAVVAARAAIPPKLDGVLDDACWRTASVVRPFAIAGVPKPPARPQPPTNSMQAMVCFDDEALYFAVVCGAPDPTRIKSDSKADGNDVWSYDCVQIFIGPVLDAYQFTLNSAGDRKARLGSVAATGAVRSKDWQGEWSAMTKVGAKEWTAEVRIPFAVLDMKTPAKGTRVELKLGRLDRTAEAAESVTWPGGMEYGATGGSGQLFFGTPNLIGNPDFLQGLGAVWLADPDADKTFSRERDIGENVIHVKAAGQTAMLTQTISVEKHKSYKFSVRAKGTSDISFRLLCGGKTSTLRTQPTLDYREYTLKVDTGEAEKIQLSWGTDSITKAGDAYVTGLQLVPSSRAPR